MPARRALLLIVIFTMLTACGGTQDAASSAGGGTDGPAASAGGTSDVAHTDEPTPHMDDHAGTEPAEFSFGRPADAADADRTIEIRAGNQLVFDPTEVTVAPGETVTFSISNAGDLPHDFVIGNDAAQEEHGREMSEMAADGMASEEHKDANAISVPAGETAELTWTFDGETDGLRYGCHVPGHYEAGMVGDIVVEG
jgi:uncharacterized cupredoxin-like copper-binding protein